MTSANFVLLVDYFPLNKNNGKRNGFEDLYIPITEIILHVCMWCLITEEIRDFQQYWTRGSSNQMSIRRRVWKYFDDDKWNFLDAIAILTYLIGFGTRFTVTEEVFIVSKIFMVIDLFLWYIRMLQVFSAYKRLGPKLLMIFHTMKDLLFFIFFILIFLFGYSITSYALITTKNQVHWNKTVNGGFYLENEGTNLWRWSLLRNVLDWGMWKIYGEIDLLDVNEPDGTSISAVLEYQYIGYSQKLLLQYNCWTK
ncbi:unnamed protein product [Didymodactylos carnosus]|uniref:Ion transport domain-containing protein n=1 Tax=Didymodactylos carnosus TaxID=1234261 RepID=A0A8S2GL65_9BILA|nr:unnamed protein product [Didymodactylos carnosus]CAF3531507.1 unnamed protein product [Didymodactylos carnosus]